ncbi:peptidoglycan-binding domain-containing protein [Actinacidiphila epipremni]|uniref:Peptidoglycan-binding protein n=1 Tax=Actinacidiphila epipremni TaxID=2053013 RepID=A0ABX0ZH27_9ACTN|nr:peptidoglycan-binding domain-containing protein [Actinacidiphila epipremni]NJP42330.1 peptidoglycan-binding protein [Actinacidiphila epipremni]
MAPQQPHRRAGSYESDDGGVTDVTSGTGEVIQGTVVKGGHADDDSAIGTAVMDGGANGVAIGHAVADGSAMGGAMTGGVAMGKAVAGGVAMDDAAGDGATRADERSAERAAALAVTEGFHPLRVRPYVADSEDAFPAGTTARPLIDVDPDGGPATTDLGLFPAAYAEMEAAEEYPQEHPADGGGAEEPPGLVGATGAAHGRHRRRRRGIVVAAAAVAASALAAGAVAVTGQVMGDEGSAKRALPEPSAASPDVTLPADAAPGAASEPVPVTHHPMRATTTPAPKTTPPSSATPSASATTTAPPTTPASTTPSQSPTGTPPPASQPSVLRLGDSGPAVQDLQRRLTDVWVYHGPQNGTYDQRVQQAVAMFQVWYGVQGDPSGVYGPATRTALMAATASDDGHDHHR